MFKQNENNFFFLRPELDCLKVQILTNSGVCFLVSNFKTANNMRIMVNTVDFIGVPIIKNFALKQRQKSVILYFPLGVYYDNGNTPCNIITTNFMSGENLNVYTFIIVQ